MFGHHAENLEILHGNLFVAHLACHTHAFEHFCGIRAGAYRTGSAETVVLAMGALTYTAETVTLNYALIALTFAGSLDIDKVAFAEKSVNSDGVAELVLDNGFSSRSALHKTFVRIYGITPGQYKRYTERIDGS